MLPLSIKPIGFNTLEKEDWHVYRERLGLPSLEGVLQFYRQVVFDHFDHFNEHYPEFNLDDYNIKVKVYSASEANELIRFFNDEPVEFWGEQYDDFERRNYDYIIYQEMAQHCTPPFPPILIESACLRDHGWRVYGRPLHLVEGTHRVSYLRHMLGRGIITADSKHEFVVLSPY